MEDYVEEDPTGRYKRRSKAIVSRTVKTVYKAFDVVDALEVAWNKLDVAHYIDFDVRKTQKEMLVLTNLYHKNIINTVASWVSEEDGKASTINYISELMRSGTLADFLKNASSINMKVLRRWGSNLLQALAYMHGRQPPIVHRDMRCDNIYLNGPKGEVKIGDWGLSRLREGQKTFNVMGSPELSAPDFFNDKHTEKVDIYAFGVCLLQMVSMEQPYSECENPATVFRLVMQGVKPQVLGRMKDCEVKKIIYRCLSPENERPSAEELLMHPFFRDWREDPGKGTNLDLMEPALEQVDSPDLELPNADDVTVGYFVVHNVPSMDRDVVISRNGTTQTQTTRERNSYSPPPPPIEDEKGDIRISVHVPLDGVVKKVEFLFDLSEDSVSAIANEMRGEFKLDDIHAKKVEDEIQLQIEAHETNVERRVANGPILANGSDTYTTNSPDQSTASLASIQMVTVNGSTQPHSLSGSSLVSAKRSRPNDDKTSHAVDVDLSSFKLYMRLMRACKRGDVETVLHALKNGASPNFSDYDRRTPLHLAVEEDHPDVAEILLQNGAVFTAKDRWGMTAIRSAVNMQRKEIMALLERFGASPDLLVPSELKVMHSRELLSHARNGSVHDVRQSLMGGADVNCCDESGRTALHYAAERGDSKVVELLLLNGAAPLAKDGREETPMQIAAAKKSDNVLLIFQSYTMRPESRNIVTTKTASAGTLDCESENMSLASGKESSKPYSYVEESSGNLSAYGGRFANGLSTGATKPSALQSVTEPNSVDCSMPLSMTAQLVSQDELKKRSIQALDR